MFLNQVKLIRKIDIKLFIFSSHFSSSFLRVVLITYIYISIMTLTLVGKILEEICFSGCSKQIKDPEGWSLVGNIQKHTELQKQTLQLSVLDG